MAEKRKPGRPSAYRPEFADLARKFGLLGATNDDLARMFNVSATTVDKWIAEIPEFSGALKEGREEADQRVADSLFRRAIGFEHPAVKIMAYEGQSWEHAYTEKYPPDTVAAIFWLKNRRPDLWRDKRELDVTNRDAPPRELTDADLERIASGRRDGATSPSPDTQKLH